MDFSRTRISLGRPLASYSKVRWLISRLRRNNSLLYPAIAPGSLLNVGCGPNIRAGFVNVDAEWQPGVDLCCDIGRPLPIADGTVGGILAEHCLEHIPLATARIFLSECLRVLQPGACIRIVVPDFEMYARAYVADTDQGAAELPNEYFDNKTGVNRAVALINELFYGSGHRFIYDFRTLAEVLQQAGYAQIHKYAYRVGADPRLLIDDIGHISESLYVEAVKP